MELSDNIKKYRKLANLTQKDLANILGCAEITIRQYETGKREPKQETVKKIAKILDVSTSTLYGFDLAKIQKSIDMANYEALSKEQGYYLNEETAKVAQQIFERKEMRALFDAAKDADPEDLETAYNMLLALKRKERKTE